MRCSKLKIKSLKFKSNEVENMCAVVSKRLSLLNPNPMKMTIGAL